MVKNFPNTNNFTSAIEYQVMNNKLLKNFLKCAEAFTNIDNAQIKEKYDTAVTLYNKIKTFEGLDEDNAIPIAISLAFSDHNHSAQEQPAHLKFCIDYMRNTSSPNLHDGQQLVQDWETYDTVRKTIQIPYNIDNALNFIGVYGEKINNTLYGIENLSIENKIKRLHNIFKRNSELKNIFSSEIISKYNKHIDNINNNALYKQNLAKCLGIDISTSAKIDTIDEETQEAIESAIKQLDQKERDDLDTLGNSDVWDIENFTDSTFERLPIGKVLDIQNEAEQIIKKGPRIPILANTLGKQTAANLKTHKERIDDIKAQYNPDIVKYGSGAAISILTLMSTIVVNQILQGVIPLPAFIAIIAILAAATFLTGKKVITTSRSKQRDVAEMEKNRKDIGKIIDKTRDAQKEINEDRAKRSISGAKNLNKSYEYYTRAALVDLTTKGVAASEFMKSPEEIDYTQAASAALKMDALRRRPSAILGLEQTRTRPRRNTI
jgi:hypothetical protein